MKKPACQRLIQAVRFLNVLDEVMLPRFENNIRAATILHRFVAIVMCVSMLEKEVAVFTADRSESTGVIRMLNFPRRGPISFNP